MGLLGGAEPRALPLADPHSAVGAAVVLPAPGLALALRSHVMCCRCRSARPELAQIAQRGLAASLPPAPVG